MNEHERAHELSLAARIEPIGEAERRWLESHVEGCAECAGFSDSLDAAVGALRLPAVTASSMLVRATQAKVRERAAEMQAHASFMRPLWIAVALVTAWAALTTPIAWAVFAWVAAAFGLSRVEWWPGFLVASMAPTLAASLVLLGSGARRLSAVAVEVE